MADKVAENTSLADRQADRQTDRLTATPTPERYEIKCWCLSPGKTGCCSWEIRWKIRIEKLLNTVFCVLNFQFLRSSIRAAQTESTDAEEM